MQKKQLSVLVLIILCFLLGCNRETPKDELLRPSCFVQK